MHRRAGSGELMKFGDIAKVLGVSRSTVLTLYHSALAKMQRASEVPVDREHLLYERLELSAKMQAYRAAKKVKSEVRL